MNPNTIVIGTYVILIVAALGLLLKEPVMALWPGRLRVYMRMPSKEVLRMYVKVAPNHETKGHIFIINKKTYTVDPECIERMGLWRVPSCFYLYGVPAPLNWGKLAVSTEFSSAEFYEAINTHVALDTINAFKSQLISPTTSIIIILLVVAVCDFALYYQLNHKLGELGDLIKGLTSAPLTSGTNPLTGK